MSKTNSPDERQRTNAAEISDGDEIFMGINLHGSTEDVPGTEYDRDIHQAGVSGTVVESLSEVEVEILTDNDRGRPLADFVVEDDEGRTFTWNVDNGYVIAYSESAGRRLDVGKIGGLYEA